MPSQDFPEPRSSTARLLPAAVLALALLPGSASAQLFSFGARAQPPTSTMDDSMYIDFCNSIEGPSGCLANGAGWHIVANAINFTRRGLIQFDVSSLAPFSDITAVTLTLHTSLVDPSTPAGTATLQRVLEPWMEGTSDSGTSMQGDSGGAGLGAPASLGEATWFFRLFQPPATGIPWMTEGGTFVAMVSGTAATPANAGTGGIMEPGIFVTFASTSQLVADVQGWVDGGFSNFGWLINTLDGGERWDSSEHPTTAFRPLLTVQVPEPGSAAAGLAALAALCFLRRLRPLRAS